MSYNSNRFFTTDKTTRKRFFKSADQGTADEGLSGSSQDETGVKGPRFEEFKFRKLRFLAPSETPEEKLARLLQAVLNGGDVSKSLVAILELLKQNSKLRNKPFNLSLDNMNIKLNPLEVVLRANNRNVAAALYHLGAQVQSTNLKSYLVQLAKLDPKRYTNLQEFLPKPSFVPRLVR